MVGILLCITSSAFHILASKRVRANLMSLSQEAPGTLHPLECSSHSHGICELKPGAIQLNLQHKAEANGYGAERNGIPRDGIRPQIPPKIDPLCIRIVIPAPYLQGRDGDWPGAGETGGVLRAHPACVFNLGEMGCSVRDFSHPRRAKIERNSWWGKGIDFQRNHSNQEAKKEKNQFFLAGRVGRGM
jgi:hypothetical protein